MTNALVLFFFTPWWLALVVLLIALFMFPYCQRSAAEGVLEASLEDPYVYEIARDNEVIIVREVSK